MDSNRINRWLTLGANVGVIAGIIFLGFEIRQNNESLDAQSRLSHAMLRVDFMTILAVESEFSAIIVKARANQELSDLEDFRLRSFYGRMFLAWEWEWGEHELGRFEAPIAVWRGVMGTDTDKESLNYPGVREVWEERKWTIDPDFVRFMESEVIN